MHILDLLKQTVHEWSSDEVPRRAAALSYYTVLSLAPLLIIVIAIAGLAFGHDAAQGQIVAQVSGLVGEKGASAVQQIIQNSAKPSSGIIATIIGVITLLVGASGVLSELQDTLNHMWGVEKKHEGILMMIKNRFLSLAMVFGTGFLLLVSLVISALIASIGKYYSAGLTPVLAHIVELLVSFCIITMLFAAIFKYLPDKKIHWRDVWIGAALTSLLFIVGKFLIGLYLGKASVASAYGAAGSLIIIIVWVYYSAQIFFFGAEFTQVYAKNIKKGDQERRS